MLLCCNVASVDSDAFVCNGNLNNVVFLVVIGESVACVCLSMLLYVANQFVKQVGNRTVESLDGIRYYRLYFIFYMLYDIAKENLCITDGIASEKVIPLYRRRRSFKKSLPSTLRIPLDIAESKSDNNLPKEQSDANIDMSSTTLLFF